MKLGFFNGLLICRMQYATKGMRCQDRRVNRFGLTDATEPGIFQSVIEDVRVRDLMITKGGRQ